jgi:murein DD-endopeptidase MepM/ murein hydrolase activator NlpD
MASSVSSAEPLKLFRYSDRVTQIDRELVAEAGRLAGVLHHFEATCTEYRVPVAHLADALRRYAHTTEGADVWVREVGAEFQKADQIGRIQFDAKNIFDFLKDIVVMERAAAVAFSKGLRFHPYAGWSVFYRDAILKLGYKGKWTITGPRSALRASGIPKNVRWFSYKYLTKNLEIKPGPLAREAKSILRKLPRNSPYLPVSTFKQRMADVVGTGKGLGGKLTSAAGIGVLLTVGSNIYEFHWGVNRHLGLRSRQFATATVADVSAELGIITVATAIGSLIPVPVVGTVAGFLVGVGLSYVYNQWLKDRWRGAVDAAGQNLQKGFQAVYDSVLVSAYKWQRDIARGAADVVQWRNAVRPASTPEIKPESPDISKTQSELQLQREPVFTSPTGKKLQDSPYYKYGVPYASGPHAGQPHPGIDLDGSEGDALHPIGSGKVAKVAHDEKGYGNYVVVEHELADGRKIYSLYAHLQNEPSLEIGAPVTPDTVIGNMGKTGKGAGDTPHLHLEIRTQEGYEPWRQYSDLDHDNWQEYWLDPAQMIGKPG